MKHCRQIPSPGGDVFSLRPLLLLLPLLLLTTRYADAQASPPSPNSSSSSSSSSYYGFSTTFNPSMAIVIVVLISAFFFLGFFSIYIRQCGGGERIASIRAGGVAGRSRRNRGLDPEVLATIPTFVYSDVKGLKISKGELECAVCLSEFEDDETLRLLPRCSHVFHHDCIDAWLASHVTCPVCRCNLADASEIPAAAGTLAAESNVEEPVQVPEEREPQPEHVVIAVDEGAGVDRKAELAELGRIANRMRAAGSRSGVRPPRFPRSHSTGHSLALVHDNHDRFTLRLPDHVRREMIAAGRLKRSASTRPFPGELEGSSRRGYRGGGEGSSRAGRRIRLGRSDRWPSFLARTISARFPGFASAKRWDGEGSVKKGEGDGSARGKLRSQFDCLGGGAGGGAKSDVPAANDESANVTLARV